MKQILLLSLSILLITGCKKAIKQTQEEIAETLIVKAITDGRWTVNTYYVDGTDYKSGFDSYEFQFKTNRTVDAVKNSSTESTGNWSEDRVNFAINADYPPTASVILQTLDGTWKIVDSTWTWVKATQTINGKLVTLELRKK